MKKAAHVTNLNQAIDNATHYKECQYLIDDCPACVIAQLYVLEGGNPSNMKKWINSEGQPEGVSTLTTDQIPELLNYDIDLLTKLQMVWDAGGRITDDGASYLLSESEAKDYMKEIINNECN